MSAMLKANQRKTRSELNGQILFLGTALLVAAALVWGIMAVHDTRQPGTTKVVTAHSSGNTQPLQLETVSTPADQEKGLSGRSGLAKNSGMLFKFTAPEQHCIWMKDMRFTIDVVWLNADKRITSIVPNMKPDSYPQSYCAESLYVIEMNAGDAAARGLRAGQVLSF